MGGNPVVREIPPGRSLRRFIDVAWKINSRDPLWVPPLRSEVATLLNRGKHPFHRHADVAYFLAEADGEAVGRIAAVVNHRHNEFHRERTGFFGFFETVDDPGVAGALLDAAAGWLRERGMSRIRGPTSFSTNEECGLLVEGFHRPPAIMMPHNPPYYARLLEGWGMGKVKDLLAYWIEGPQPPPRLVEGVRRIAHRAGIRIRPLRMERFWEDVERVKAIYNSAWARNWGFVPMTDDEFHFLARQLKPVVDPDLCLFAEADGEAVAFSLSLPDLNQALKPLNGRLFPFGIVRLLLWERRKIEGIRILTLGIRPGFRRKGIDAALYLRTWEVGTSKGYRSAEASWILEDNWEMRRALEKLGGRADKRYRIYEADL